MLRQPGGGAAFDRHHENIVIAVPLRGERDARSVRRPNRVVAVVGRTGERHSLAACCRHQPDLPAIGEGDAAAIGRNRRRADPQGARRVRGAGHGLCREGRTAPAAQAKSRRHSHG